MEEAYRHERETREGIEEVPSLCHRLKDILGIAEESADENRLLPAMNKIWPFLVTCVRNGVPVVSICFLWSSILGGLLCRLFVVTPCVPE